MGRYDILLGQDDTKDDANQKASSHKRGKTPDTASMQRELRGSSKKQELTGQSQADPVPPVHPVRPVLPVRGTDSIKRVMKSRHPFDIYHDQYESLKELALQDRMQGGEGSMSAMVRQALDDFIEQQKRR
jgi:hypothetical protein